MRWAGGLALLLLGVTGSWCLPWLPGDGEWAWSAEDEVPRGGRVVREVTLGERALCGPDDDPPSIRVDTAERVTKLREQMAREALDAYIIPSDCEHQSEYVAQADKRREYVSGFSGSAGTAIVTRDLQALWTDGRYFLQADEQLDCKWLLMKQKNPGVPKMMDWLKQRLIAGSRVGADPRLIGSDTWNKFAEELKKADLEMVAVERNLVDEVWKDRPAYPRDPVYVHDLSFAGKRWEEKVADVRAEMEKEGADLLVVTALDEVAWLLNLRGNDIPYNPVFRGYVVLGLDSVELYIPPGKITPAVDHHLNINQCNGQDCVKIMQYTAILNRLRALRVSNGVQKVMIPSKYSYSGGASYAVYSAVPENLRLLVTSPVLLMKSRKNDVEVAGMKNSQVKDSVALVDFLAFLEKEIDDGKYWNEISAAEKLAEYRAEQKDFMGLSFTTISAFGSNGAIVHYQPILETTKQITNTSLFLLDSGGQYKDGTTDVTRTMHYGEPSSYQVETYTRVLMGATDLAMLTFPEGTGDADVDIMARRYLYEVGLDYRHGTGHGIGHFLNVHEAPTQIRIYGDEEHKFEVNQFFSDEPGFYEDYEFGIRLETIMRVVEKGKKFSTGKASLGFEAVTLVPFEAKLINVSMLTGAQCEWINSYHVRVRQVVGDELMAQGRTQGYEWLLNKTEPLECSQGQHRAFPPSLLSRVRRQVTLEMRQHCSVGDSQPVTRVDTTDRVAKLRQQMDSYNIQAYIIPSADEHLSEYVGKADKRRGWLTGFSGSAGTAIVTRDLQALWTDGRYFLAGDQELDCNWLLMKDGEKGVPKQGEWLGSVLEAGMSVGADARLMDVQTWEAMAKDLNKSGITLVAVDTNLVDAIWKDRPSYPSDHVVIHELQFAGKRWEEKVAEVRAEMEKEGADLLVVTALDEVAWLLNLRGNDIPNTPVFRAYVLLGMQSVELFLPAGKMTPAVDNHLNINQCGDQECVTLSKYETVLSRLRALDLKDDIKKVLLPKKYSYSGGASYALYSAVPERKRLSAVSPVLLQKARKTEVEANGMINAHVRDAVALTTFLADLEREMAAGTPYTEMSAAETLEQLRRAGAHYTGPSFTTISAYGPHGSVIHYRPTPKTNAALGQDNLFLLDSGGQYKDGTTDVTRTMHYGVPSPKQIEAYTRVLMGAVDLALLTFPEGTADTKVDILARRHLYKVGLDYGHGTGHGIGHYLGVHEAPTQLRIYGTEDHKLEVGHFFSDEPGYYEDNMWGIRLETILRVVPKTTKYQGQYGGEWLGFEAVTLVPFEANLISVTLMSNLQCEWVNAYHRRVREVVGAELQALGRDEAHDWLVVKTEPLACPSPTPTDASTTSTSTSTTSTSTTTTSTSTSTSTTSTTSSSSSTSTSTIKHSTSTRTVEYTTSPVGTYTEGAEGLAVVDGVEEGRAGDAAAASSGALASFVAHVVLLLGVAIACEVAHW